MGIDYKDYYAILGVERNASSEEIRKIYRKLARQYHPDLNKTPEAEKRYLEINEAYEVLKDPEKRAKYDQLGSRWQEGDSVSPPPGWSSSSGGGFDFGGSGPFGGGFSDFFNMFFGGMGGFGGARGEPFYGASGGSQKPRNQEFPLEITLREAAEGTTRRLTLEEGNGNRRNLSVRIPPGVAEGSKVRLAGKGASAPGGGEAGDLYLRIHLLPDPLFKPEGRDLHTLIKLAPWEASLGAKITVPTLEGDVVMTIPPGTQSGMVFRLKHKGLPRRKGERGHLFVKTEIAIPKHLSPREKELLEQLSRESSFKPRG
jgi:curved DNA-binding protein